MKMKRVRAHQIAGAGEFDAEGIFCFHRLPQNNRTAEQGDTPQPRSPKFNIIPEPVEIIDSGFMGFLRYPQPSSKGTHDVLARRGAGLMASW